MTERLKVLKPPLIILDLVEDYQRATGRLAALESYHKWMATAESKREEKELTLYVESVDRMLASLKPDQSEMLRETIFKSKSVTEVHMDIGWAYDLACKIRRQGINNLLAMLEPDKAVTTHTGQQVFEALYRNYPDMLEILEKREAHQGLIQEEEQEEE